MTSETRLPPRRKWTAIAVATVLLLVSYTSILLAFVIAEEGGGSPGPPLAFGLGLVPFVFLVLAFMSGNRGAPGAVLRALGLSVLAMVGVFFVSADPATALVAAFGAGGVVTLRFEEDHSRRARWIAVGLAAIYSFVLVRTVPIGVLSAGVLPLLAVGLADTFVEQRAAKIAQSSQS